jgi:hypothetical protein
MSAWVVSKHHIDLLVSAIIERGIAITFADERHAVPATLAIAEKIGRLLWAENIRSVIYRYRLDGSDEEAAYLQDFTDYRFRFYPGIRESAVDKALACFYQACECPDYETTAAFSILTAAQERHRRARTRLRQ